MSGIAILAMRPSRSARRCFATPRLVPAGRSPAAARFARGRELEALATHCLEGNATVGFALNNFINRGGLEAFEHQARGRCFSLVEVLSTCPTNWGMSPNEASDWLAETMIPYYPLGVLKRPEAGA